ncbi:PP2C family protein-serine/threonine phosphatase [Nannocystis pusilla]|uniref:PP2C family protein-serine/threonine phosphatase n=1 Tax=Nannocystis pusilla TaxID=889268 RepID=UPI003B7DB19A
MSISFMVGPHRVRFAGKTDIGLVRAHNEDSLLIPREMALAVVSDGMGGHAAGDVASRITVETIDQHYRDTARSGPNTWPFKLPSLEIEKQRMSVAIQLANSNIFETAAADGTKKGMGCTVDAIYFNQGRFFIGHVGDSRVYRIREGRIQMLTEDHSLLNDYLRMKELSGDEGVHFPRRTWWSEPSASPTRSTSTSSSTPSRSAMCSCCAATASAACSTTASCSRSSPPATASTPAATS